MLASSYHTFRHVYSGTYPTYDIILAEEARYSEYYCSLPGVRHCSYYTTPGYSVPRTPEQQVTYGRDSDTYIPQWSSRGVFCAFISQSKESIPFESSSSYDVRQSTMHASECSNVWYSDTYLFPLSPTCSERYLLRTSKEFPCELNLNYVSFQEGFNRSNMSLFRME